MTQVSNVTVEPKPKFWLGQFYMTTNARSQIDIADALVALRRHHNGDWGDVCPEDREANETALANGGRLFSVFHTGNGVRFWIITEANRNTTTVLMPDDY
jgi:hypothetical protein